MTERFSSDGLAGNFRSASSMNSRMLDAGFEL